MPYWRVSGGVKPHAIDRFRPFAPDWSDGKIRKFLRYCKRCIDKDGRTGRLIVPKEILEKAGLRAEKGLILEYNFGEIENIKFLQ